MRKAVSAVIAVAVLGLSVFMRANGPDSTTNTKIHLRLVDQETGKGLSGIIRMFRTGQNDPLPLPGLFDRLHGLERTEGVAGWAVIPEGGKETTLPRAKLRLEALAGLETTLTRQEIDLTAGAVKEAVIPLRFLFRPGQHGLASGNTHLHLRGSSKEEADEYLRRIPAADGLKVLFISYLERKNDDLLYITNRYPMGELKQFDPSGTLIANGEEHRHNFGAYGQGYGHVMLLAIKQLVKPVSLGPGLTGTGTDDQALRVGIDQARRQEGTVIWCHNTLGHEDVPNALAGRFNALNVFDGSRTGAFEDTYYRYLNIGLRLPLSTGTDWFVYDFSRVYARVTGRLSISSWLEALRAGRTSITNGPLLTLRVDGRLPGEVIALDKPRALRVEATAIGRHDFRRLQLVRNGRVIHEQSAEPINGGWSARLAFDVRLDGPAWLAVRIDAAARNELGHPLFAHSSPVYVDVDGKSVFAVDDALALHRQIEEAKADIQTRGKFSAAEAQARLLSIYDDAAGKLQKRLEERGK